MNRLTVPLLLLSLAIFFSLLLSYPVMLLWNYCLVDAVSVVKSITWMQAWGLTMLVKLFAGINVDFKN